MFAAWRDQTMTFTFLKELVPALELAEGGLALTYVPDHADHGVPEFAGWLLSKHGAAPFDVECEPVAYGIATLEPRWPAQLLQAEHVVMIGSGTIGSATALALGSYGVGRLTLVDPDRIRFGNLKRLPYDPHTVGRFKVDVVADAVRLAWPDTEVTPLHLDVVQHAAELRALLPAATLVVCTADGVLPRRVAGHLARRVGLDTVLGCVLDDGAVIEVLRLRALHDAGCLQWYRASLAADELLETGFDPEGDLHRSYGDGMLHKPMTAVGGDLNLAGAAVAKVAVSTLLHNAGKGVHTLPGETLLISVRASDLSAPYGDPQALRVQWLPGAAPRSGCFTCGSTTAADTPGAHESTDDTRGEPTDDAGDSDPGHDAADAVAPEVAAPAEAHR